MLSMSSMASLLVLLLAVAPAMATDYTVGDSSGWTTGVDYSTWASDKTFKVGDTLLFTYGFLHSVDEVNKADYAACSTSNTLDSHNDQSTTITLDKAGSRYFVCGTSGHCSGGMKLAVDVAGGSSGGGSGSPTTPTTPSTPSTPAGSSSNSPSTPAGTPSEPSSKNTPSSTKANAAAGSGFSGKAVVVGMSIVGLALMG